MDLDWLQLAKDPVSAAEDLPRPLEDAEIESICDRMRLKWNDHEHTDVEQSIVDLHRRNLRAELSKVFLRPSKFQKLSDTIVEAFYKALISPGEAVGVNAAQSIGEPTTQQTLNSVVGSTDMIIATPSGLVLHCQIGTFIDNLLASLPDQITTIPENRTELLALPGGYFVPSVDNNTGAVSWQPLTAITRHLPVGDLVRVRTSSGRTVTATRQKSFLVWNGTALVPTTGETLALGALVPIAKDLPAAPVVPKPQPTTYTTHNPNLETYPFVFDQDLGYLIGAFVANGDQTGESIWFVNEQRSVESMHQIRDAVILRFHEPLTYVLEDRVQVISADFSTWIRSVVPDGPGSVPSCVWTESVEFVEGFVDGYSRFRGSNNSVDSVVAFLYARIGTFCSVAKSCPGPQQFNHVVLDPIVELDTNVSPHDQYVYDLTVPSTLNFVIGNGLGCRDTFHSTGISAKNVTLGFPRAKELFDATPNSSNPTVNIYFRKFNRNPSELHRVTDKISQVSADDLIVKTTIVSPQNYATSWWQPLFKALYPRVFDWTTFMESTNAAAAALVAAAKQASDSESEYSEYEESDSEDSSEGGVGDENLVEESSESDSAEDELDPAEESDGSEEDADSESSSDAASEPEPELAIDEPPITMPQKKGRKAAAPKKPVWWCLALQLSIDKMFKSNITNRTVAEVINGKWADLRAVWSPLAQATVEVFVDCAKIAIGDEQRYLTSVVLPDIRNLVVAGVPGVKKLYPRKVTGYVAKLRSDFKPAIPTAAEEWMVDTDGANLEKILQLPYVDTTRTLTNDFWDFFRLFGIEAARSYLIMEFMNIVTSGGSTAGINQNHVKILVDKMTYTGSIRSVARYGVEESQYGPITRASFEEVIPNMVNGAIYSEKEPLNGISSNVAMGKLIAAGTGLVRLKAMKMRVKRTATTEDGGGGNGGGSKRHAW